MSDRITGSSHSPRYVHWLVHAVHDRSVWASIASASTDFGGARCDGPHVMTNEKRSPWATANSPIVVSPTPWSSTSERIVTISGPAIAHKRPSCSRLTHGTIAP